MSRQILSLKIECGDKVHTFRKTPFNAPKKTALEKNDVIDVVGTSIPVGKEITTKINEIRVSTNGDIIHYTDKFTLEEAMLKCFLDEEAGWVKYGDPVTLTKEEKEEQLEKIEKEKVEEDLAKTGGWFSSS